MYSENVAWSGVPRPEDERTRLNIVSAPPSGNLLFVVLNERLYGAPVHWIDNRTTPCTRGYGCRCELMELSSRWKGWLGGLSYQSRKLVLVEVTANAARLGKLDGHDQAEQNLRGLTLRLSRCKRSKTGKVIAELTDAPRVEEERLPPPPDVRVELARIWNAKR